MPVSKWIAPLPDEKLRVLTIIARFTEYSETYMQEELLSL